MEKICAKKRSNISIYISRSKNANNLDSQPIFPRNNKYLSESKRR
jgi:hypothetical protein